MCCNSLGIEVKWLGTNKSLDDLSIDSNIALINNEKKKEGNRITKWYSISMQILEKIIKFVSYH